MAWLNYHHLYYFWTVARRGSIAAASQELLLSQPTISAQLKTLETTLNQRLFTRQGRRLVLTEVGQTTFRFADDIFRMGRELQETLERSAHGPQPRFAIGIADVIPKMIAERLLEPAFLSVKELLVDAQEGNMAQLLARLALHELDVVFSDQPAPTELSVRAFNHLLGESGTSFFAVPSVAAHLRRGFPKSLHNQPMLLPSKGTALRRQLDLWLEEVGVQPKVVGTFDDSALMIVFGSRGRGVFVAPTVIEDDVLRQYTVHKFGAVDDMTQRFFAISVERRIRHPALVAIAESARKKLFG